MNRIIIHRCASGHEYFYRHARCPACDTPLEETWVDASATLVGSTTVRVNPSGAPFHLGLARLVTGATTLCILAAGAPAGAAVTLRRIDGIYHGSTKLQR